MTLSRKQLDQLKLLNSCPRKLQKTILKKLPSPCIKAICECCLNVLKGNVPLSKHQKGGLRKHKGTLRKLADRKPSLFTKKKLIVQKGGFLNILLPAALSALAGLMNGVL